MSKLFLWIVFLLVRTLEAQLPLAIVRAYASSKEIEDLEKNFNVWNTVLPCDSDPGVAVDLILVYSRSFQENPLAQQATQNVINSFESGQAAWAICFRSITAFGANLSADEDVYDIRGYSARNDWANGPNMVFNFIMNSFYDGTFGTYDAMFFMELDAEPVRSNWLMQFISEAYDPFTAIRGSRYRGDTWDAYLSDIPQDVLFHINGNAIYNLTHPWMARLVEILDTEIYTNKLRTAFDVRMAALTLEEYANAQDIPYRGDSRLVGNYAQTLLNTSFEVIEYIRHGSAANVFNNVDEFNITLGVLNNSDMSALVASFYASHPFRKILVIGDDQGLEGSIEISTTRGPTVVEGFRKTEPWESAFCELAQRVTTKYVTFADSHAVLAAPIYVLVDAAGKPVLPYIPAESFYCTSTTTCTAELEEAETLFGVKLNYHQDIFETVFETEQFLRFCDAFKLVASNLGTYDSCGLVNGITADAFMAWAISITDEPFNFVPKNKERLGARSWGILATAHEVDTRNCSVYTEEQKTVIASNITHCGKIIEDASQCEMTTNCTWRPLFGSGRCVDTVESRFFNFFWTPPSVEETSTSVTTTSVTSTVSSTETSTVTGTTVTGTGTTVTGTATTQTVTVTSTWTTVTGTTSVTGTSVTGTTSASTVTGTSVTTVTSTTVSFTGTTVTYTTATWTALKQCFGGFPLDYETSSCQFVFSGGTCTVECIRPLWGSSEYVCDHTTGLFVGSLPTCTERYCEYPPGEEVSSFYQSDCQNITAGGMCVVSCPAGYVPAESMYFCGPDWTLWGILPPCERTQCDPGTLPPSTGADFSQCIWAQIFAGDICTVPCMFGYGGATPENMTCLESGDFQGQSLTCEPKSCVPTWPSNVSFEVNCRDASAASLASAVHGDICVAYCMQGYAGQSTQLQCVDGSFQGSLPTCLPVTCTWQGFTLRQNVDNTDCDGKKVEETCQLTCEVGYDATGSSNVLCQTDNFFSEPQLTCSPSTCGDLSLVSGFPAHVIGHDCASAAFQRSCSAFCLDGYRQEGGMASLKCSGGTVFEGYTNQSGQPPEPPTCVALPCTSGFPTMRGAVHNCSGVVTGESCTVEAMTGYEAVPALSVLLCLADGSLSGQMPEIQPARCADGNFSEGVGSTCRDKLVDAECWAYCQRGYVGDPQRYFCRVNAATGLPEVVAENVEATCAVDANATNTTAGGARRLQSTPCDATSAQSFGLQDVQFVHSCANLPHDEVCVAHCDFGWELTSAVQVLVCDTGNLQGILPECQPLPCNFSWPGPQVSHNCTGAVTGESCAASCIPGYTGQATSMYCSSSGNFAGTEPTCEPIVCDAPQMDPKFSHDCSGIQLGQTCTVVCAAGYDLAGEPGRISCSTDGSFTGELPNCSAVSCANIVPNDIAFGRDGCDGMIFGDICNVTCNPGYVANTTTLECSSQGALVGRLPICRAEPCSVSLLLRPELMSNCEGVTFGKNCSVFCAAGFEAADGAGLEQFSCKKGGLLEGALPNCVAAPCVDGLPLPSDRSDDNCTSLTFGETCTEQCAEGYGGAPVSYSCGSDSVATASSTSNCRISQCAGDVVPALLESTCTNVSFGRSCYAYCPPGYVGETLATRLQCFGPSSGLPVVGNAQDVVTLRGTLPDCAAAPCTSNIPWQVEYQHNCSTVVTGQHCMVSCADGWFGDVQVLSCQASGVLRGDYPSCVTTTYTSTWTTTRTVLMRLLKMNGAYRLDWSNRNASKDSLAESAVEQSLYSILNGTLEDRMSPVITVRVNQSDVQDAVDLLFEIELWVTNDTVLLLAEELEQLFDPAHVPVVQAALRNSGVESLSTVTIARFEGTFVVDGTETVATVVFVATAFEAGEMVETDEHPKNASALIVPLVLLVMLLTVVTGYIFVRVRRMMLAQAERRRQRKAAAQEMHASVLPGDKGGAKGREVRIMEGREEVQEVPAMREILDERDDFKAKTKSSLSMSGDELQLMADLGISLQEEDDVSMTEEEKQMLKDAGLSFTQDDESSIGGEMRFELSELGITLEGGSKSSLELSGEENRQLEEAGIQFEDDEEEEEYPMLEDDLAREIIDVDDLFEEDSNLFSEDERDRSVRVEVMDTSTHPPRINPSRDLSDVGIHFEDDGTSEHQYVV